MSTLGTEWREHLRLALLRLLVEAPGQQANDSVLTTGVRGLAFAASRDQVRGEVAWLADQGCVSRKDAGSLILVSLLDRGADAATGIVTVPGVQRPSRRA